MKGIGFFTDKERRVLDDLSDWLSYDNAISNTKGHMTVTEMADAIGMDRSNFAKVLKSLTRKNAIGAWISGSRTSYYMNPDLYCKGDEKQWLGQQFSHEASLRCERDAVKIVKFNKARIVTTLLQHG